MHILKQKLFITIKKSLCIHIRRMCDQWEWFQWLCAVGSLYRCALSRIFVMGKQLIIFLTVRKEYTNNENTSEVLQKLSAL